MYGTGLLRGYMENMWGKSLGQSGFELANNMNLYLGAGAAAAGTLPDAGGVRGPHDAGVHGSEAEATQQQGSVPEGECDGVLYEDPHSASQFILPHA